MLYRSAKHRTIAHPAAGRGAALFAAAQDLNDGSIEQRAAHLRHLLQQGGPLHSSLAIYLSSRIDLLPAEYCRELASTPDHAAALSPSLVQDIMLEDFGPTYRRTFCEFDNVPYRAGLIDQCHAGVLANGDKVAVYVLRPQFVDVSSTSEILARVGEAPLRLLFHGSEAEVVLSDFAAAVKRATNLQLRGQALQGRTPGFLGTEQVRKLYSELSGKRLLTVSRIDEAYCDQLSSSQHDLHAVARHLCHAWLRETLYGRYVPVDLRIGNTALAEPMDVSFLGREFLELPPRTKENLRQYLLATLVDDPDRAALHLLQEMHPPRGGLNEVAEFRSKFRQAAYFGALEPVLGTDTNALAQLIFQHWRTALDYGYKSTPDLLCFYRGLFSVARAARELAPADDPLREGLEELDADMMFEQLQDIARPAYWFQSADKFAMAIINFPQAVDEALNRGAGAGFEGQIRNTPERPTASRRTALAPLALLVGSMVFVLHLGLHNWADQSVVLALMIAGLMGLQASDS
jgi:predicted unusual protein kinase regulating ubiquinone biosynthesis (AarF/ABC1/UbiB family)